MSNPQPHRAVPQPVVDHEIAVLADLYPPDLRITAITFTRAVPAAMAIAWSPALLASLVGARLIEPVTGDSPPHHLLVPGPALRTATQQFTAPVGENAICAAYTARLVTHLSGTEPTLAGLDAVRHHCRYDARTHAVTVNDGADVHVHVVLPRRRLRPNLIRLLSGYQPGGPAATRLQLCDHPTAVHVHGPPHARRSQERVASRLIGPHELHIHAWVDWS